MPSCSIFPPDQNRIKIGSKIPNRIKIGSKSEMGSKSDQNRIKIGSKSDQNRIEIGSNSDRNRIEIGIFGPVCFLGRLLPDPPPRPLKPRKPQKKKKKTLPTPRLQSLLAHAPSNRNTPNETHKAHHPTDPSTQNPPIYKAPPEEPRKPTRPN